MSNCGDGKEMESLSQIAVGKAEWLCSNSRKSRNQFKKQIVNCKLILFRRLRSERWQTA